MIVYLQKWFLHKRNIAVIQIFLISMLILNTNIHFPSLPALRNEMRTDAQSIQYFVIMMPFVSIFTTLACGILADIYNRKPVLIISLFCFLIGTIVCMLAASIEMLLFGRFLQALGDSNIGILWIIILGDYFHGRDYARLQALANIILMSIVAIGPVIGALALAAFGWRANFLLIFIPLALLTPLLIAFWKDPLRSRPLIALQPFHYFNLIKRKGFLVLCLMPVIPTGIFTAFSASNPFIFVEYYGFSAFKYSIANFFFISANVIGGLIYIPLIHYASLKTALKIGTLIYIIYIAATIGFLITPAFDAATTLITLLVILNLSLPFIGTTCTAAINDAFNQDRGFALAMATLLRNFASTAITIVSCASFQGTAFSVFAATLLPALIGIYILRLSVRELKI